MASFLVTYDSNVAISGRQLELLQERETNPEALTDKQTLTYFRRLCHDEHCLNIDSDESNVVNRLFMKRICGCTYIFINVNPSYECTSSGTNRRNMRRNNTKRPLQCPFMTVILAEVAGKCAVADRVNEQPDWALYRSHRNVVASSERKGDAHC